MNLNFILALSIGIVCGACSKQTSENRMGKQLYTMQELPHKVFSLDDSTTQVISHIHTFFLMRFLQKVQMLLKQL